MLNNKKYALIVPTYNRNKILASFLNYISVQTLKPDVIVVVNDGSTDATSETLKNNFPEIIEIVGHGDWWWTGSVNRGLEYVLEHHKDIEGIVLQNDDTRLDNNWFEKLITKAQNTPHSLLGCVAVYQNQPDKIAYAGRKKNSWFAFAHKFHLNKSFSDFSEEYMQPSFDLIGRGCYIPTKVFRELGLFDEVHFKHRGDTELPLRARMAGYNLFVYFGAKVYIDPQETASIDIKEFYSIRDIPAKFFDFRSSAYWKYRYYYAKTLSKKNILKWHTFFVFRMMLHFAAYFVKLKYFKPFRKR